MDTAPRIPGARGQRHRGAHRYRLPRQPAEAHRGIDGDGPDTRLRGVVNLVERMGDEIEFRVVTRDRDLGDSTHYPGIVPGRWTRVGRAHVWYLSTDHYSVYQIAPLLRSTPCDVLYFNSLFSRKF